MKNTRLALAFAASLIAAPTVGAQSTAAQFRTIDSAWARSYATNDTMLAKRVMAADIVITATNGSMKDLAKELEDVKAWPGMTVNYFRSTDVIVHERGNVVTGRIEWETAQNGRTSALRRRYTATYARGGPLGWQIVALHIGSSPPQP
jgi:ketosteroid isomerase-like protein